MPHKELKKLILEGKDLQARQMFLDIVEKEYLWRNAFKRIFFNPRYKEGILDWSFFYFCKKIKEEKLEDMDTYSGVIVNTIREAKCEYNKEISLDIAQQLKDEYSDYIEGVNPFDFPEEPLEILLKKEKIDIIHHCLDQMGNPCQDLIRCKHFEELTHEEIVERNIGFTTEQSSRSKLSQCMEKLRKMCFNELNK